MAKKNAWNVLCIKKIHLSCCTVRIQANINAVSRSSILTTFGQVVPECIKIIIDTALHS